MSEQVSTGRPVHGRWVAGVISAVLSGIARLTPSGRRWLGGVLGQAYYYLAPTSRSIVRTNLSHCFPELAPQEIRDLSRATLVSAGRLVPEVASCWRGNEADWRALIAEIDHSDALAPLNADATLAQPQPEQPGILLLVPHFGNWELLNMYLGAEYALHALYDPPKIAALEPLVRAARQRSRSTLLPIGAAGMRSLLRRLRSGGLVAVLPDQVPPLSAGVHAPFFGQPALTMTFVHRLVVAERPRVVLGAAQRHADGRYRLRFEELSDTELLAGPEQACSAMNQAIERWVQEAPEQYQWAYKRFKRPPTGSPSIY